MKMMKTMNKISLSFGQKRFWALDQLEGPSGTYNIPFAIEVNGQLDIPSLERALEDVVLRHEPLRTIITPSKKGLPLGYLLDLTPASELIQIRDISSEVDNHKDKLEQYIDALIQSEISIPFDIQSQIPFRACLLKLDKQKFIFIITIHHHACDGISQAIIAEELSLAYSARIQGLAPSGKP